MNPQRLVLHEWYARVWRVVLERFSLAHRPVGVRAALHRPHGVHGAEVVVAQEHTPLRAIAESGDHSLGDDSAPIPRRRNVQGRASSSRKLQDCCFWHYGWHLIKAMVCNVGVRRESGWLKEHPVRVGLRPQHVPARPVPITLGVPGEEARQGELQVLRQAAALLLGSPHLTGDTGWTSACNLAGSVRTSARNLGREHVARATTNDACK